MGGADMKKAISVFVVLASILFVADYVSAENHDYSDLAGRKWSGTRIVTYPNRMVIKAQLEITNVTNGEAEGFYKMEVNGSPQVVNFKSAVDQSANGLPRFKFTGASGSVEFSCELQKDGRLITVRSERQATGGQQMTSPHVLDPVK
jgi:hypothetical protein